jgi:uncharacterized protein YecE (DUF72 family)
MSMDKIRVGTSGYSYFWNEGMPTPFKWYCRQGFPTVEVNASFYRFPSKSWIRSWEKCPSDFEFSIKVHRAITHYRKLGWSALKTWMKFKSLFREIEDKIAFWLFQMPPNFTATVENVGVVSKFFSESNLGNSAVIEFRHASWWKQKGVCKDSGSAFCSVDAPDLPTEIVSLNDVVYLRLHGRHMWYAYVYSERELEEILDEVKRLDASKKYIYLNNDHGMLPNGKFLMLHV